MCTIQKSSANYYLISNFIAFFYIPFVLLTILYAIILIKLKQHAHPGEPSANAEKQRSRKNRNVLKMAIVIVFAFFLCWIPFITNRTISHFAPNSSIWYSCNFLLYDNFTYFMAATNCAINPMICLIFSSNYRQGLKRLFSCCAAAQEQLSTTDTDSKRFVKGDKKLRTIKLGPVFEGRRVQTWCKILIRDFLLFTIILSDNFLHSFQSIQL